MIITNVSTTYLKLTAIEIAALITTPSDYTKIEVTANINCCISPVFTQTLSYPFTDTENLLLLSTDSLRLNPAFFGMGLTSISSNIYSISVKLFKTDENILIANCAFIDPLSDISCKVAALLHNIISEYEDKTLTEKPSLLAHILHYSLINGSNCGCNCDELCKNYIALLELLSNVNPELLADCGCN